MFLSVNSPWGTSWGYWISSARIICSNLGKWGWSTMPHKWFAWNGTFMRLQAGICDVPLPSMERLEILVDNQIRFIHIKGISNESFDTCKAKGPRRSLSPSMLPKVWRNGTVFACGQGWSLLQGIRNDAVFRFERGGDGVSWCSGLESHCVSVWRSIDHFCSSLVGYFTQMGGGPCTTQQGYIHPQK